MQENVKEIPIYHKEDLTVKEAAQLTNIGQHRIRKVIAENPDEMFHLKIGKKLLIKRELFVEFINGRSSL